MVDHPAYSSQLALVQCAQCGLFQTAPPPDEDKLSQLYGGIYHYNPQPIQEFLTNLWARFELEIDQALVKRFVEPKAVLDIGAGRGDFLKLFETDDWQPWVHDPFLSQEDIEQLHKKIGKNVNIYPELNKYPAETFDCVLLRNVIEHTTHYNELLADIYRILKPNGLLFIRTPNIDAIDFQIYKENWYVVRMAGHMTFFSSKTMTDVLSNNGFTVPYCKGVRYNAPLSAIRSNASNEALPIKAIKSAASTIKPFFSRRGGDLQVIATKTV